MYSEYLFLLIFVLLESPESVYTAPLIGVSDTDTF